MLSSGATVPSIQVEQVPAASDEVVSRPRRMPLTAHAIVAFVAAVDVGLLATADAAAADDLGGLVGDVVRTVEVGAEPVVEPTAPLVEPALEELAGQLAPVLEEVAPVAPVPPIDPIDPIVDAVPPLLDTLDPGLALPVLPVLPVLDVTPATPLDHDAATRPISADSPVETAEATAPVPADVLATLATQPAFDLTSADGGSTATLTLELGDPFDSPVTLNGPLADAGTTLIAALLIGLSMAVPTGWAASAIAGRLQPISLTLAPPVPPG